jgi:diadenosine tetraphosphate (Ap4A) HIT family hydrolase
LSRCEFCDEFSGGLANEFALRYGNKSLARTLLADDHFRIVPSLGQLVEGHLLLVPLKHFTCFANLESTALTAFSQLKKNVRAVLTETYGRCVFFEHGIRQPGSGGCGIDHAHMHAVPVSGEGVAMHLMRAFRGRAIHTFSEVNQIISETTSYLFFEDASEKRYVFEPTYIPSQYMRKVVAESIGKSNWDWRNLGCEPELLATLLRLAPLLSAATISPGV